MGYFLILKLSFFMVATLAYAGTSISKSEITDNEECLFAPSWNEGSLIDFTTHDLGSEDLEWVPAKSNPLGSQRYIYRLTKLSPELAECKVPKSVSFAPQMIENTLSSVSDNSTEFFEEDRVTECHSVAPQQVERTKYSLTINHPEFRGENLWCLAFEQVTIVLSPGNSIQESGILKLIKNNRDIRKLIIQGAPINHSFKLNVLRMANIWNDSLETIEFQGELPILRAISDLFPLS